MYANPEPSAVTKKITIWGHRSQQFLPQMNGFIPGKKWQIIVFVISPSIQTKLLS